MDIKDTRLLRVGTHDATEIIEEGAGFTINLGNVVSQIQESVIGFSVESVGFYNLAYNVSEMHNDLMTSHGDVTVPPGFYTVEDLTAYITTQLTGGATMTVVGERVVFTANSSPTFVTGGRLALYLGFGADGTTSTAAAITAPNHYDLGGERVAFLHTDTLHHSKHSFDGEGLPVAFSCSFPITVFYGEFQTAFPNQYQKPVVRWDEPYEVREINFRLRNIRGELLNVQGTEWWVVLRLFLI